MMMPRGTETPIIVALLLLTLGAVVGEVAENDCELEGLDGCDIETEGEESVGVEVEVEVERRVEVVLLKTSWPLASIWTPRCKSQQPVIFSYPQQILPSRQIVREADPIE